MLVAVTMSISSTTSTTAVTITITRSHQVRWMMKLTSLSEFARAVFQVILTGRFVRTNGKGRFAGIDAPNASSDLDVGGMMILARFSVFAPTGTKKI